MTLDFSISSLPTLKPFSLGRKKCPRSGLTVSDQVLGDVQGDFDNERAADMRGAHKADHTAGDADQRQGGLIHRTSGRTHWKQDKGKTCGGQNLGSERSTWPLAAQLSKQGQLANLVQTRNVCSCMTSVTFICTQRHVIGWNQRGLEQLVALRVNNGQGCASHLQSPWAKFTREVVKESFPPLCSPGCAPTSCPRVAGKL